MADRRDNNILPLVAGVVISAGILALLYKMFFTGKSHPNKLAYNQQIAAPTECTCSKGGKERLFSSEERERRERERKRREEARRRAEEAAFQPDEEPEPYSPLKIAGGTLGVLLALLALLLKTVDNETLREILDIVGLGHLVPKPKPSPCIDPKKQKWPLPPPPPPCPKQKPKKC